MHEPDRQGRGSLVPCRSGYGAGVPGTGTARGEWREGGPTALIRPCQYFCCRPVAEAGENLRISRGRSRGLIVLSRLGPPVSSGEPVTGVAWYVLVGLPCGWRSHQWVVGNRYADKECPIEDLSYQGVDAR